MAQHWWVAQEALVLRSAMLLAKREALVAHAVDSVSTGAPKSLAGHVPLLQRPTAATVDMVHAQAAERAGRKKRTAPEDAGEC